MAKRRTNRKVIDNDKGFARALAGLKSVRNVSAVVGIRQEKGAQKYLADTKEVKRGKNKGQKRRTARDVAPDREDVLTLAEIAAVNEYGSEDGRIPARPVHGQAFDKNKEKNKKLMEKVSRRAVDQIVDGGADGGAAFRTAIELVAIRHVGRVQEEFLDGNFRPNAPQTIEEKGSSRPLIDTGRMRQSIDYALREGGVDDRRAAPRKKPKPKKPKKAVGRAVQGNVDGSKRKR